MDPEEAEEVIAFRESWIRQKFMTSPEGLSLIYVLRMDGTLLVKRVLVYPGKQLEIRSDNLEYNPFTIDLKDPPEDFAVVGRVLWSFRSY